MWGVQGCGPQSSERQLQQLRRPQMGSRFGAGTNICLSALCPPQGLQKQQLCPLQTQTNLAKASQSRCSGMKSQDALQDEHAPSARSGAWAAGATGGLAFYFIQTRGLVPHSFQGLPAVKEQNYMLKRKIGEMERCSAHRVPAQSQEPAAPAPEHFCFFLPY